MGAKYKEVQNCSFCNCENLFKYLDLGRMPLVNSFITPEQISTEEKFPLEVLLCQDCSLSQTSVVIDPEFMFRDYAYRSSISSFFRNHCTSLAEELNSYFCKPGDLILDIASNDGCLLKPFKSLGNKVLGVDPAINLARIANGEGIKTIPDFWTPELARSIKEGEGLAKVITAFNVFAHVEDIHSFVQGVKIALGNDGFFILESPHILDLLEKNEFDTIYHEHLYYLSLKPVQRLMSQYNMKIAKVEQHDIHGGSLRVYIEHDSQNRSDGSFEKILDKEKKAGIYDSDSYEGFTEKVETVKRNLNLMVRKIKQEGKTIDSFGASAKGNILLNYCGINHPSIGCVYDHTPEKQGKLTPGTHIPIINPDFLLERKPDYLFLAAWNFAREIMEKTQDYRSQGGRYIIPIPNPVVI